MPRQRFLIGMRQSDLPRRRCRLFFLELQCPTRQPETVAPQPDRPRRHQQHLDPELTQPRHIVGQRRQPRPAQIATLLIDQQCRANLDHQPPRLREGSHASFPAEGRTCRRDAPARCVPGEAGRWGRFVQ